MFDESVFLPGVLQHRFILLFLLLGRLLDFILDYYNALFSMADKTQVSLARRSISFAIFLNLVVMPIIQG